MDGLARSFSGRLTRTGSRRLEEEAGFGDQTTKISFNPSAPQVGEVSQSHGATHRSDIVAVNMNQFQEFCSSSQCLIGGSKLEESFLLETWIFSQGDINRSINRLLSLDSIPRKLGSDASSSEVIQNFGDRLGNLAKIMGLPEQMSGPEIQKLVKELLQTCMDQRSQMEELAARVVEGGNCDDFNKITEQLDQLQRLQEFQELQEQFDSERELSKTTSQPFSVPLSAPSARSPWGEQAPTGGPFTAPFGNSSAPFSGPTHPVSTFGGPAPPYPVPPGNPFGGGGPSPASLGWPRPAPESAFGGPPPPYPGNPFGGGGPSPAPIGWPPPAPQPPGQADLQLRLAKVETAIASLYSRMYCGVGGAIILFQVPPEIRSKLFSVPASIIWRQLRTITSSTLFRVCTLCSTALGALMSWKMYNYMKKGNGLDLYIDIIEEYSQVDVESVVKGRVEVYTCLPVPLAAKFGVQVPGNSAITITKPEWSLQTWENRNSGLPARCAFVFECPTGGDKWGGYGETIVPCEYRQVGTPPPVKLLVDGSFESGWTVVVMTKFDSSIESTNTVVEVAFKDTSQPLPKPKASKGSVSITTGDERKFMGFKWNLNKVYGDEVCTLLFKPFSPKPDLVALKCDVPQFTLTGIRVRYLRVNFFQSPVKWIRYLSKVSCFLYVS